MTKTEIIQSIISDMQAARSSAKAERDAAYFKALCNKEFAAADQKVRVLTASGKESQELKKATADRDKLFAKFYKPKNTAATCSRCGSLGYANGKICTCVFKKYTEKLIEKSGFTSAAPNAFNDKLLSVFADTDIKNNYKKIYKILGTYCETFPPLKQPNIVLCGATGTGKTYAVQITANCLLSRGVSVFYTTAFNLVQRFKTFVQNFNDQTETDVLFDADLLIIDDLGTEPQIKNISQEYIYNVINERLTQSKPFIITTNLSPATIFERYDQRIASRILGREKSVVIEMKSPDLRFK